MLDQFLGFDRINGAWAVADGSHTLQNRGFAYGDGIFDTFAIYQNTVLMAQAHIEKTNAAARALGLLLPEGCLQGAFAQLCAQLGQGIGRFYAYRVGALGHAGTNSSDAMCFCSYEPRLLSEKKWMYTAQIASHRADATSVLFRHKTLSRLPHILAEKELGGQPTVDALWLNQTGVLASSTVANLIYGDGHGVYYVPPADGCLWGASLQTFLYLAKEANSTMLAASLPPEQLGNTRWLVGLNSLGPRFYTHVNNKPLAACPPAVVALLKQLYPFF